MSYIIVTTTFPSKEEALRIIRILLKERLVACANIMGPVSSLFWWKEKIDEESEFLVIMKSHKNLFGRLSSRVMEVHSYDVPEIVALPIVNGLPLYLDWLKTSLRQVSENDSETNETC